ncbi:MAG: peptidase, partial [Bacteroidetes bacterium]|nr:peptidase [Bacteroidota bacterium]
QLISHHSVIFEPEKGLMWVSTQPFQLGEYVCYDLNKIFAEAPTYKVNKEISEAALTIPADRFLMSEGWKNFLIFKSAKEAAKDLIKSKAKTTDNSVREALLRSNPNSWESYFWAAELSKSQGDKRGAAIFYDMALAHEINDSSEVYKIKKLIKECNKK